MTMHDALAFAQVIMDWYDRAWETLFGRDQELHQLTIAYLNNIAEYEVLLQTFSFDGYEAIDRAFTILFFAASS